MKTKNIICIESWEGFSFEPTATPMKSLLDFIAGTSDIKYTYSFVRTPGELAYVLKNIPTNKHSMLYLALHGKPGEIQTGAYSEFTVKLHELAEMMGDRFYGYGIHFAACAVMNDWEEELRSFKKNTGARFVSGYRKYVEFTLSSIVDHALIASWIGTSSTKVLFKKLSHFYKNLLAENGFDYIT